MSIINPRTRLVNFRLSEVEFKELKAACLERGARSISEFARTAVLRSLDGETDGPEAAKGQMQDLERKVDNLEVRVDQLLGLLASAQDARRTALPPNSPVNGEARRYRSQEA